MSKPIVNILNFFRYPKASFYVLAKWLILIFNFKWSKLVISVQFSLSAMSDSLWPHGLQHARLPCPSPTPTAYSNLCQLSQWCHPTISSSVILFSSCLQSFPALESFQWVSSSHQVVKYWSFRFSISSSNKYSVLIPFRIDWFDLAVQGTLKGPQFRSISSVLSFVYGPIFIHDYWKTIALTRWTFVGKVMSLLFNILSRFSAKSRTWLSNWTELNWTGLVIAFLPRSKRLLISWLQSPSAVILELKKIKSLTVSMFRHLFVMK